MKNKKNLLILSVLLVTLVRIPFLINVKGYSGSFYIYPNGTHSNLSWMAVGGITIHGCVADQSESKYIYTAALFGAECKLNMDDGSLGNFHAYKLKFYMYARCVESEGVVVRMRMKVAAIWHNSDQYVYDNVYFWYSFDIDGWWTDAQIDAMRTGLRTFAYDCDGVWVSRVKVLVYWTSMQMK